MPNYSYSPAMQRELTLYRDALPAKLEFDALARMLEDFDLSSSTCLDAGMSNPVMSFALRDLGGEWLSLVEPAEQQRFSTALEQPVETRSPQGGLPFEEKQFDLVVLGQGFLAGSGDELAFLRECHRVLKPTGSLVFSLAHAKPWALANLIKRVVRPSPVSGVGRRGYTERELFETLKIGFDVFAIRTYCRFWVTLVRIWEQSRLRTLAEDSGAARAVRRRAGWMYRLAYQLDGLLFWTRGYVLLVNGRRHVWRDRNATVLRDGRRISEAVLSREPR